MRDPKTIPGPALFRVVQARWAAVIGPPSGTLLTVMLLITLASMVAACGGEAKLVGSNGTNLQVYTTRPEIAEKITFQDAEGNHRVVRPKASNRQLAVVNITIVNRTTTVIPMLLMGEAIQIGDRRGEKINVLDPFISSKIVDEADPEEDKYLPFMWGEQELDRGFQMSGWIAFDVPKGIRLTSLWWNEVDQMIVDYVPYTRQ